MRHHGDELIEWEDAPNARNHPECSTERERPRG